MFDRAQDSRVRAVAFEWLSEQVSVHGDVLRRQVLIEGFILDSVRVPVVGPQGIFKPRLPIAQQLGLEPALHSRGRPKRS